MNLRPTRSFDKVYLTLGQRLGRGLFDQIRSVGASRPGVTPARVFALILSLVIHGLTLATAGVGLFLLTVPDLTILTAAGGLLCLATAWALRPRFGAEPSDVIDRGRFPALYACADRLAGVLGVPTIAGIVVTPSFGAALTREGRRRRTYLYLGLPLIAILDGQERVALIAHELAHQANGNPRQASLTGSALASLEAWYSLLYPDELWPRDAGAAAPFVLPANLFLLLLASVARGAGFLLISLMWRDGQRAEYAADELSAWAAGGRSAVQALRKTYLGEAYRQIAQSIALDASRGRSLVAEIRELVGRLPANGVASTEARELQEGFRLDATHPPTAYRIAVLDAHAARAGEVTLTEAESREIERELVELEPEMLHQLREEYRAGLYH